jgi:N-acetylglucosamine-6-sulfatase
MDGVSLVPVLTADPEDRDRAVLIEGHAPSGPGRSPYRGVRTSRWSYTEWEGGDVELYDLEADRAQMENLAGEPQHAGIQAVLADATARLATCSGEECRAVRVG